jgi:hypothetical protein
MPPGGGGGVTNSAAVVMGGEYQGDIVASPPLSPARLARPIARSLRVFFCDFSPAHITRPIGNWHTHSHIDISLKPEVCHKVV